jgi:hypothetical protein
MTTRSLAAWLALGSILGVGCYSEPLPPSTYRYACEADSDCNADELCRRGRCEQPCSTVEVVASSLLGAELPCALADGLVCQNGACASTCALGSDYCPRGYTCLDIGLGSIGGGGFGGGGSNDPVGVCTLACDDQLCPPGEACREGACAPIDCSAGQACPEAHACFFGLCMPSCTGGQACPEGYACSAAFGVCEPPCFPACAADEACFFGACAVDCSEGQACPEGYACFFGLCAPDASDTPTSTGTSTTEGDAAEGADTEAGTTDGSATEGAGTTMGAFPADDEERR